MTRPVPGPRFQYAPGWSPEQGWAQETNGDIAVGVGTDLGWDFDPEQQWLLKAIFAEDDDGLPASGDVAIIGPRQTVGKTAVLECAAITDITVFDQPLHVWTAHEFKISRKVLGLLGNSGNTSAPHLHFHLMNGTSVLGSSGLPYTYDAFGLAGHVDPARFAAANSLEGVWSEHVLPSPEPRTEQYPLDFDILDFPR